MMQGAIEDARRTFREMPLFAAAVFVVVALGVGARAAVFYEADGEDLRLIADRSEPNEASEANDPMTRMRARLGCAEKIPGFTVVLGLSHYNLELSVPVGGIEMIFDQSRPDVARVLPALDLRSAA